MDRRKILTIVGEIKSVHQGLGKVAVYWHRCKTKSKLWLKYEAQYNALEKQSHELSDQLDLELLPLMTKGIREMSTMGEVVDFPEEPTYVVKRFFALRGSEEIASGLSLEEAKEMCSDPETSSRTCTKPENTAITEKYGMWFMGYNKE